jgi:SAM-dependent methyltransferase
MSRSEEVVGFWSFRVEPAEKLSSTGSAKGWDKAASWWVSRYSSRGDLNREWVIDPILLDWLGNVDGLRVLDAGCGEGYLSRLLAERGARVVGVDLSRKLLAVAKKHEASKPMGVRYLRADLADLSAFQGESFDLAVSNIVLVDVARYREAIREIFRVLKHGGRFLFCITHPAFEGPVPGRWVREPIDSFRIEDRRFLAVDRYFDCVAVFWGPPDGKVVVGGFHRPLRDYFEALHDAGFLVSRFEEPTASKEALARRFFYFADLERVPLFLIIEAVKPVGKQGARAGRMEKKGKK